MLDEPTDPNGPTNSTDPIGADNETIDTLTRRECVASAGAVIAGTLLTGCTGSGVDADSSTPSDPAAVGTGTATETEAGTGAATEAGAAPSYSVTMAPMGTVEFDKPPETWLAFLSTYGDMGIALGQADGLRGLWDPESMPTAFYDALPDVEVSLEDVTSIAGGGEFDAEVFYELDCDLHLIDPNWLGVLNDDWNADDAAGITDDVGPFLGNYIRRHGDQWHDYRYYSLYEAFEIVANAFNERERYEAFAAIHDEAQRTIDVGIPPAAERPTVGLVSVNSDFEGGSFYVYPVQEGNNHKQYRDLGMRGAFDDHLEGSYGEWDYEQLLAVDPDAIVFQYGFSHVSATAFEDRMDRMRQDPVGSQLSAVRNDRLYRGGGSYQGPIVNLFQTEAAARQFYPDAFGDWNGIDTLREESLTLFNRQQVADVINGAI
ncbi:iron complex transport system substrate-binding protein [Halopenitus malekzadehii]|uniref:Iron complex transport system substrate-binding protein n=1 Tax=Halopenitus malekzadehii TaxID=1267564 RepID=A0A1H6K3V7_9EURY|nr:ABC transporter substrate-binding protein [Halopenitus malekzadehii]SEH66215.1 iron complex transport system substrate-binding protein [Halopenitus malekzadehii]